MTEDQQFAEIMAAVQHAVDDCLDIVTGHWGVTAHYERDGAVGTITAYGDCCCPMGALVLDRPITSAEIVPNVAADILGVSLEWVTGFTNGFDLNELRGETGSLDDMAGKRMGIRVRAALGNVR